MNHVPTVGSVAALGLLLLGYVRRNEHLKHVGLEVLFVIARLTLPVYVSGVAAHHELRGIAGLSATRSGSTRTRRSSDSAWMEFAGFVRVGRAVAVEAPRRAPRGTDPGRDGAPGRVARGHGPRRESWRRDSASGDPCGGVPAPTAIPNRFMTSAIGQVAVYSTWAWPAAEAVHFLGLSLSFGVLLAVNLRILGVMKQVPFAAVHRLLPWGMLGFGANLITGMFFFVGQPGQYRRDAPFLWKVVFLMIAGANFLYLTVFGKGWDREGDAGFNARLPTRRWRSSPSSRGSPCCSRAACCPSWANPSEPTHARRCVPDAVPPVGQSG